MIQKLAPIPKQPVLKAAEDFYRLRREGIGFIEQMGSHLWTDYNIHDPGITILEALCYAFTDLAYRIGWDIKDLLASPPPATMPTKPLRPYADQAFFTARDILTVNPVTPDDFRRLLIDLDRVRNAWVFCKECACELHYYAWCEAGQLMLSYKKPTNSLLKPVKVDPRGLYEVLLELEADPELGDLNDRKLETTQVVFDADSKPVSLKLELRFPALALADQSAYARFTEFDSATNEFARKITKIKVLKISRTKPETTFTTTAILQRYWRDVFYVSFEITFDTGAPLVIPNAALRLYGGTDAKGRTIVKKQPGDPVVADQFRLTDMLEETSVLGSIQRYRQKLRKAGEAIAIAKTTLHNYRNLDEDYCQIKVVDVEDVAVCADVEVAPDADIERIQAQIWFEIDRYFNPPVPFYSLQELLDAKQPVEGIFNGPALENGFIKADELQAAGLKTVLRTSDIINRLMDIKGVIAVNELLLSKYDAEGNIIKGAADPVQTDTGLIFDPNRFSAKWQLWVSTLHQPRLYYNQSQFLFYKNGLPFRPRMDEALDTLTQLRGEAERPKIKPTPDKITNDLPAPVGKFRNPEAYFPVQYSFPMTYGIGPEGLPSTATPQRRAQAKQLKAYLMVFEQLLGNTLSQVAHSGKLFSLESSINKTYYGRLFDKTAIEGYTDIVSASLTSDVLQELVESGPEFEERRNRFLDHLLARFGEQFSEYALMLTTLEGQHIAQKRLIDDKISFLKAYPTISHDRGKAFNYQKNQNNPANASGLKRRISLLLGYPNLTFTINLSGSGPYTVTSYTLTDTPYKTNTVDETATVWLTGTLTVAVSEADEETARYKAFEQIGEILEQMIQPDSYEIVAEQGKFRLNVRADNGDLLGTYPTLFDTETDAKAIVDEFLGWSSNERALVVEHLLLRPKFPGDALYPACADGDCGTCGDEDPYSFRLTYVMPGWTAPFSKNLDMRRFANRTIQQETPAHLLGKICWVSNDGFIENPCDPVVAQLAELLEEKGKTTTDVRPSPDEACTCALALYTKFSLAFKSWYADKTLTYFHPDALQTALEKEFSTRLKPADVSCTTVLDAALWVSVQSIMVTHFVQIAFSGLQFERFEDAWQAWLQANAAIDWTEQQLQERVEGILSTNVEKTLVPLADQQAKLCQCATAILTTYGMNFYTWMEANVKAGVDIKALDFTKFDPDKPAPLTLCTNFTFSADTLKTVKAFLTARYATYVEVSYRLRVVVDRLSKLRNTYPGATLHDCDDGSDQNPVRLGSTALGNYPTKKQ
ncbi:hypothetical protein SAMN06269250_4209 [Spirosoma fluviale]|uniref:Uncharacterized protein n=2 Tax=Spirosoma fluviale TaxID=1597977 RepID=A0A286GBF1_9BACT|nr:hypothetical protein SAMN06269250_4209 [Spirosoma fluviale]